MKNEVKLLAVILTLACGACSEPADARPDRSPVYGEAFRKYWYSGGAEIAGYRLAYPRYGQVRKGTAVAIFVTEPFSESARVKHESPGRPAGDAFPALKLNLVQDFATGVYDYNMMTSVFVALRTSGGRPAGTPAKVSFSSQEWCGHVYEQALLDRDGVRISGHSYFDGEGDRAEKLPAAATLAEDALLLWARGLAAPTLASGESMDVRLLRSLEIARLRHVPVTWDTAKITRASAPVRVLVPAGTFKAEVLVVEVEAAETRATYPPGSPARTVPSRTWRIWVERAEPRRVVKWTRSDGISAELLGVRRMEYWSMNGNGFEKALEGIGLEARPPRTP